MLILVAHCKIKESVSSSLEFFLARGALQIILSSVWFFINCFRLCFFFFYQYDFLKITLVLNLYTRNTHTQNSLKIIKILQGILIFRVLHYVLQFHVGTGFNNYSISPAVFPAFFDLILFKSHNKYLFPITVHF